MGWFDLDDGDVVDVKGAFKCHSSATAALCNLSMQLHSGSTEL